MVTSGDGMKTNEFGEIQEATEFELWSLYWDDGYNKIYNWEEFLNKVKKDGTKII